MLNLNGRDMKKYKYILLDWDGNLAKTLDIWLAALKVPLENRGILLKDAEIGANFMVFKERMQALGVKGIDTMVDEAMTIAVSKVPDVELYDGVSSILNNLKQDDRRLALVTT